MRLAKDEIFTRVQKTLAKMLKIPEHSITTECFLKDDLGIDSVDGLDMAFALEKVFKIEISDAEIGKLKTVQDVIKIVEKKI